MPGARQFFGMTLYAVRRCKTPPSSGSNENEQTSGASYIDWLCSGRYNWASWMFPKHLLLFRELEWLESKCYDLEIPRRYTEPHRKPLRVPEKARRLFNDWHCQNHIAHGALLSAVAARNGEICNPKEAAAFARAQQRGLPIPQEPGGADGADSDAEAEDDEEEATEGGDGTVVDVDVDVDVGAPGGVHLVIQDKRRRNDFASTEVGEAPGGRVTQQAFDVVHQRNRQCSDARNERRREEESPGKYHSSN